ncbi:hypothetical protein [Dechloromonas sp. HYN0024]|uniref:hypothetical protein n=1 Tax=Dechloromonas sp. HYN0024 TaxID=2231055 RepID=UPI000E44E15E|nr:hypothetical protein [Dechloromonas sp. HYN0024]AXS79865.1 hypothetical protein HYN24_07445 [Dechloromonas sp. HYN0024]
MVDGLDIGKRVVVKTDDTFYEFINGWECTIDRFESGFAVISRPSDEFQDTTLVFYVPPESLELVTA